MKIFTIIFLFILAGCSQSKIANIIDSLHKDKLVKIEYTKQGKKYFCNPEQSQKILLTWSDSLKEPQIASWADADEFLDLEFSSSKKYHAKVTFTGQNLRYSTIRFGKELYIGDPINVHQICNT